MAKWVLAFLIVATPVLLAEAEPRNPFGKVPTKGPVVVAIVDTGYTPVPGIPPVKVCRWAHKDFSEDYAPNKKPHYALGEVPADTLGHGTLVAHIVDSTLKQQGVEDYCLVIIKAVDGLQSDGITDDVMAKIAVYLSNMPNLSVVNYSMSGVSYIMYEDMALKSMLARGVKIIASAGNDGVDLDKQKRYPAMYDERIRVVGYLRNGGQDKNSNYGYHVRYWANGVYKWKQQVISGSSFSAPVITGKTVMEILKKRK